MQTRASEITHSLLFFYRRLFWVYLEQQRFWGITGLYFLGQDSSWTEGEVATISEMIPKILEI